MKRTTRRPPIKHPLALAILGAALAANAAVPVRWTVETSRVQPAAFEAYQGETLTFEAALQSYGKPISNDLQGARIYWQTNGMGSAYWSASASAEGNVLRATWTPAMDVGARAYNCFIGAPSNSYRAAFQLRLRPSPGATPNALPLPTPVIDFAAVEVANAPWLEEESDPTVPAWAKAASKPTYTAGEVGALPLVEDSNRKKTAVTIGSRSLSKSVGVFSVASGWSVTASGTGSRAEGADVTALADYSNASGVMSKTLKGDDYAFAWNGDELAITEDYPYYTSHGVGTFNINPVGGLGGFWIGEQTLAEILTNQGMPDNGLMLTNGSVKTKSGTAITPSDVGAASAEDLEPLSQDIARAYQYSRTIALYMTGNTNAWFAGTNYVFGADAATRTRFAWEDGMDAATVPCSMALWEIRDGVRQCVWDQRDWPTWYWSFKAQQMRHEIAATNRLIYAAINEAVTNDSNHAWAKRYASTGRRNPDASTTFIDTPSVTLSPGMSWETVATVDGCGYWTIVGNGAVIGGSGTNATLNIKDFEGNSILEITKGQHMLAWLDSSDFVGNLTDSDGWICFDMMADVKPTGYFSTTLVAADFVAETDANCPAQYRWEDLGGHVWRVHFLLKPGIVSDACFAKFQVEVEGKTQIRYNADTVINGGLIFEGVKIAPVIQSGAAVGSTVTWKVVE